MEFRNLTPFDVMCFSALSKLDIEHPVIVMKVGYRLQPIAKKPGSFSAEVIDDDPVPLCLADKYYGEEGRSSVKEESDLAPFKPRCDVIVNGHAYAPGMEAARSWTAGIRLSEPAAPLEINIASPKSSTSDGPPTEQQLYAWRDAQAEATLRRANAPTSNILLNKRLRFTGPRTFKRGLLSGWHVTEAEFADRVPLQWEYAFGGASILHNPQFPDHASEPHIINQVCYSNPLGQGWVEARHFELTKSIEQSVEELLAPQIEQINDPISKLVITRQPDGDVTAKEMAEISSTLTHQPAGFGVVGRAWAPRLTLAGTYDDEWRDTRWPGLPADFEFGYWNCAPADQQTAFLKPGVQIELFNLTSQENGHNGRLVVELPGHRPFLLARLHNGALIPIPLLTDTLVIDTDAMSLSLTHRISLLSTEPIRALEARFEIDPTAPLIKRTRPTKTADGERG
ncbi:MULTISPECIES: DUF2169 family type VI secretion system accessory protein [Pseudomonas]|uniref:DUF2169 family type VI secretion system accessory protein n=1 Tax=Pseudomonas TaxID=286 RepID=UPI000D90DD45|nr:MULTISPECIES: DUF2169 domain-containing protein [Pseudomonas]MBR7520590.1 DUF2169 domain-containing protein [Pseudomonas juntendi]PYB96501.1 DUF2169 domain-containing protein [Pseudomonas sp. MB-090624]